MPELRSAISATPHSGIRRMLEIARAVEDPLMLVNGDPDFTTPAHIIEGAAAAARNGATGYAPGQGLGELREAISEKVRLRNKIVAKPDLVCVTTGACGGLYTTLLLLLDPGDEILVPDPGWANYAAMAHVLGAQAVGYPVGSPAGWALDAAQLEGLVTPRTRAILVNSPGNPTGDVAPPDRLSQVLDLAERHDLWVVSDEAYDELVFDGAHTSTASLGGESRVVSVFSFSKTYAMTGWRVGYVVGPREFIRQLALHQEPVVSCASTVSQQAALAALSGPQDCVTQMVASYRARRDLATARLDDFGCAYHLPEGSFFLMVDTRAACPDSWEFTMRLLEQEQVGVVPGAAFGQGGEGFVRVSLSVSHAVLEEGISRIGRFAAAMKAEHHRRREPA